MRTTQETKTEKITKTFKISVPNISISPTIVVLTLTLFERKGGET